MQGVFPVIVRRRRIFHAVNSEFGIADTVGHGADHSAQEALTGRRHIVLEAVVTHNNVLPVPFPVFREGGHYAGTEIGYLDNHVTIFQGVQLNGLPVQFRIEFFRVYELRPFVTGCRKKRKNGYIKDFFHLILV